VPAPSSPAARPSDIARRGAAASSRSAPRARAASARAEGARRGEHHRELASTSIACVQVGPERVDRRGAGVRVQGGGGEVRGELAVGADISRSWCAIVQMNQFGTARVLVDEVKIELPTTFPIAAFVKIRADARSILISPQANAPEMAEFGSASNLIAW